MKRFRFQDVLIAVAIGVFVTSLIYFRIGLRRFASPRELDILKTRCHYKAIMRFRMEVLSSAITMPEYLLILSRRGRSLSWQKSGDIPQDGELKDNYFIIRQILLNTNGTSYIFETMRQSICSFFFFFMPRLTRLANSQNMININIFRHFSLYRLERGLSKGQARFFQAKNPET